MSAQPLVSVRVATYNQEKYVGQCLEGVLMQRTDFAFEVVVGEDCSTDRTREIVLAYAEKHPDKIRVLPSEKNLGSQGNSFRIQQACRGKYHAMLEGDDYWIDPLKLQKQVDFMEAHPDVTMCFHNAFVLHEGVFGARLFFTSNMPEILTFEEVCWFNTPTASNMARSDVLASLPSWRLNILSGDVLFRLWCAHHGKVGYLNEIMAVHRRHPGGLTERVGWTSEKWVSQAVWLYQQFDQETGYVHTDLMQRLIEKRRNNLRFRQWGWFHFLIHPGKFVSWLKEFVLAVVRRACT